jgi:hypothetical protein
MATEREAMKNFAFTTLVTLTVIFFFDDNPARAQGLFSRASESDELPHGFFRDEGTDNGGMFRTALSESAPATATKPVAPKAEAKAEGNEDGENEEPLDDGNGVTIEVPGGQSFVPSEIKTAVGRCREFTPLFEGLIAKYCKRDTQIKPTTVCALWLKEGVPPMCLGGSRGERCLPSSAGAEGAFQCMPSRARTTMRGMPYDPQVLEDSATCGVHFLCDLEQQVGEKNMFMGYYAGPGGNFSTNADIQLYDKRARANMEMFNGSGDMKLGGGDGIHNVTPMLVGIPPIDPGLAYIGGVFGDHRDHGEHKGQDWFAKPGTPTKASFSGAKVTTAGWTGSTAGERCGGQLFYAMGGGEVGSIAGMRYCHLSTVTSRVGDILKAGQVVGNVGAPGDGKSGIQTSEAHLHVEVYIVVSRTVVNGKVIVKTMPYNIMARWFDLSPFIAGTVAQNPRYQGPRTPEVLKKTARLWTH